jgi:hypothetical protein
MTTNTDAATDDAAFRHSYGECREAFLAAAGAAGAVVDRQVHPTRTGSDGEELSIDVARWGRADAPRLLVFSSGIHGCEGYAGSAVQIDTLRRLRDPQDDLGSDTDVAYLFVHALNPYGWSHGSRTNEDQVDLNRNFIDDRDSVVEHRLAEQIQEINQLCGPAGPDMSAMMARFDDLIAEFGLKDVAEAVQSGQYFQPAGVGYGGDGDAWSTGVLRALWDQFFPGREVVGLIDWHTGIGAYGETALLCFDSPGSPEHTLAEAWWGAEAIGSSHEAYDSGSRPHYNGLHVVAGQEAARRSGAVGVGAVIEFGTFEGMEAATCLWIDRWLRNKPEDADPAAVASLRARTLRFFFPDEDDWKTQVVARGRTLVTQASEGITAVDISGAGR